MRRLLRRLSLRARLTLLAAVAVALSVAAAATASWFLVRGQLRGQVDDSLSQTQVQPLLNALRQQPYRRGVDDGAPRLPAVFAAVDLVDGTGATQAFLPDAVAGRLRSGAAYVGVASGQEATVLRDDVLADGSHVRVAAFPATVQGRRVGALVIARSLAETDDALSRLRLLLVVVTGLGILGAASVGLVVARAGLRPVDRLTGAAEEIARTENLDVPIEVRGDDEVARLARSFNAMTAALARSRTRQQQLVADAGHELRTPLTSLRTNIDLLVRADGAGRSLPPADRERLLGDLSAQIDELTTLVGELVGLARDERSEEPVEDLDLAVVAGRAVERARLRAGSVHLRCDLQPWPVRGRAQALERAVVNLVDNAVKFSPPGGAVEVSLAAGELTVADRGPGAGVEDLPHVFDRFYRAATARGLPGSGLGLAIVAQTAQDHGGAARLVARPGGGTLAQLWLPAASGSVVTHQ